MINIAAEGRVVNQTGRQSVLVQELLDLLLVESQTEGTNASAEL